MTIPHIVCSLWKDVVVTGHVGSCYLYDVWVGQLAEHLELMLCMGVANLDGDQLGRIDLPCSVVLAFPDHTELTSVGRGGVCEYGTWVETSFNSQLIRNMH